MTPERARGLTLYAVTAALLAAGGIWFVRAAPGDGTDPRIAGWKRTVTAALPDSVPQVDANTVVLGRGADTKATAQVTGGSFRLTMVCAGEGDVWVALSSSGNDSGLPVPCSDRPQPISMKFALATQFYLAIMPDTDAAVFRWQLLQASTF
jgi:hypothetical protein